MSKMTDEEKEKADFEAGLEGLSDEEKAKKIAEKEALSKQADVNVLLEEERAKRKKAEDDLAETRRKAKESFEERERKRKEAEEKDNEDDKPVTRRNIRDLLAEERETVRKEMREDRARELAGKLSENHSEAELVVEVWKNRTLAGTLQEQIKEALAIVSFKKMQAKNNELKRALLGKDGTEKTGESGERNPALADMPNLSPADKTVMAGYVWDNGRGMYRKTIAGGRKILFVSRDLKTRKVEDAPKK